MPHPQGATRDGLSIMQVYCLSSLDELASYADDWDRLARGVPFRGWAWASSWWRHYGRADNRCPDGPRLLVPCVFDLDNRLVGLAPWYVETHRTAGRTVRMIGSGEIASDYLSLLARPGMENQVAQAVADWLTDLAETDPDAPPWDLLEMDGVDAADPTIGRLVEHLVHRGNRVHCRPATNCWRIALPRSWQEYLATLSKSHRKQIRRLERELFDTGRAVLHSVERLDQLPQAIDLLFDLHQRRRRMLGDSGRFVSGPFPDFHREVMPRLLREGQLQLSWLALDGRPAAVEYHLAAEGVVYAYQSGIDPELLDRQPGRAITVALLRRAIEQGYRAFDFLRGDEPYKAHYRAAPRPSVVIRVVPNRTTARLRHGLWLAGHNVKQWLKESLAVR